MVFAAGPDVRFSSDPDTAMGMRYLPAPGAVVALPNQIVGWAAIIDGDWQHSLSLFDPVALRRLREQRNHPG